MAHWHQDTWPAINKGPRLISKPSAS
jgi:hypothetical protein